MTPACVLFVSSPTPELMQCQPLVVYSMDCLCQVSCKKTTSYAWPSSHVKNSSLRLLRPPQFQVRHVIDAVAVLRHCVDCMVGFCCFAGIPCRPTCCPLRSRNVTCCPRYIVGPWFALLSALLYARFRILEKDVPSCRPSLPLFTGGIRTLESELTPFPGVWLDSQPSLLPRPGSIAKCLCSPMVSASTRLRLPSR